MQLNQYLIQRERTMRTADADLSLIELMELFPDNAIAEKWFEERRWPNGRFCPHCGDFDTHETRSHKPLPYRCRGCDRYFSVRKGTVMESSKLSYQTWAIAVYLFSLNPKGVSSVQLHNLLGIRQATAWHLLHRIREGFRDPDMPMQGPVEVDETYVGGLRRNMSTERYKSVRARFGIGYGEKHVVIGIKDRATGKVVAEHVPSATAQVAHEFIRKYVRPGAEIFTDESPIYGGLMGFRRGFVTHSKRQYVDEDIHTNGIESFWSGIKRGYKGTYHYMSPEHLSRYVKEFTGRFNMREHDMIQRMEILACGMAGRRLRYKDLVEHGTRQAKAKLGSSYLP